MLIPSWLTSKKTNNLMAINVKDYEKGVIYANMTTPNDNFMSVIGTLREKS